VAVLLVWAGISFVVKMNEHLHETLSHGCHVSPVDSFQPSNWTAIDATEDIFELMASIMTPFAPWFLADFYLGDEFELHLGEKMFASLISHTRTRFASDCTKIPERSVIFVQVNFFEHFRQDCLTKLVAKVVLITGQWHLPAISVKAEALQILDNPNILHWFAQNPIVVHEKYTGIPYGVLPDNLPYFVAAVKNLLADERPKATLLLNVFMAETHPDRFALKDPSAERLEPAAFYEKISGAQFVVSPMGDRPDSYRHWESIGLGSIPICNCPPEYNQLFRSNMIMVNTSKLLELISDPTPLSKVEHKIPNRDVLLLETWKQKVHMYKSDSRRPSLLCTPFV